MIKFTDVLKANLRYWYVIVICILLFFGIIFGVKYEKESYIASNQYFIEKEIVETDSDGNVVGTKKVKLSASEVGVVYDELNTIINNPEFMLDVINSVKDHNSNMADKLTSEYLRENYEINYEKNKTYVSISFKYEDSDASKYIMQAASKIAVEKYKGELGSSLDFKAVYPTSVIATKNQNAMFGIIGVLVGLVIGEIVLTCIVAFIPYVEDKEILKRVVDLDIIATLDK